MQAANDNDPRRKVEDLGEVCNVSPQCIITGSLCEQM